MTILTPLQPTSTSGNIPSPLQFQRGWVGRSSPCLVTPMLWNFVIFPNCIQPNPISHPMLLALLSRYLIFHFPPNRSRWCAGPHAGIVGLPQVRSWTSIHPAGRRLNEAVGAGLVSTPSPNQCEQSLVLSLLTISNNKWGRAGWHSASTSWYHWHTAASWTSPPTVDLHATPKQSDCLLTQKIKQDPDSHNIIPQMSRYTQNLHIIPGTRITTTRMRKDSQQIQKLEMM